ncbi:histone-like protein [Methanosphaera sp. BMS]|uniref:histone-like protein n=1 Tax=Methanosphaera sp. BMS TaxID=1789762 RepID=UPI000DC1DE40|nr:histone-like protein [Methanosphaera sp. BMS]AWX31846.1 hypothetical protein AW729_01510 [Methanosphaera sp. BMS]
MSENRELILNSIKTNGKQITDDALDNLEELLNVVEEDPFETFNDKINYINWITTRAIQVASDAKRDVIIEEDFQIMLRTPKDDVTLPFTPIKRLIDNNTSKNINKDAAIQLTSDLDEYCRGLLLTADNIATEKGHKKIMKEDIDQSI